MTKNNLLAHSFGCHLERYRSMLYPFTLRKPQHSFAAVVISPVFLLNVYAHGEKPDGAPWRVAVQDPQETDSCTGVLSLRDAYAITSGGYQRYFEQDGQTYHHIIDPATGYPADSGLLSVTIVAPAVGPDGGDGLTGGTMADAFSTALFVMGEERAIDFWRRSGYEFDMVLVTADGRLLVTDGLEKKFERNEDAGYIYEIIR